MLLVLNHKSVKYYSDVKLLANFSCGYELNWLTNQTNCFLQFFSVFMFLFLKHDHFIFKYYNLFKYCLLISEFYYFFDLFNTFFNFIKLITYILKSLSSCFAFFFRKSFSSFFSHLIKSLLLLFSNLHLYSLYSL